MDDHSDDELQRIGKARDAEARWAPIIDSLVNHVGHNVAVQITRRDVVKWTDHLLETLSPKTVRDSYLATARAAFSWAVDKIDLKLNPFAGIRVRLTKKLRTREKGFRLDEAQAILKASRAYKGSVKEHPKMTAAKQWCRSWRPIPGARRGDMPVARRGRPTRRWHPVRPDNSRRRHREVGTLSGCSNSRPTRRTGLHRVCEEERVWPAVLSCWSETREDISSRNRRSPSGKWVRSLGVIPPQVQPSHAWRHRLKTVGRELGADPRVLDAIQGHASPTAGDDYGDVTLAAKLLLIKRLPQYDVDQCIR
ncbi:integrase [Bradyrhizobium sp. S3.2.6]